MTDRQPSGSAAKEVSGPFAALHYRDFRLFWIGLFISNVGTWMQMTAISWLLYDLTNSPLQLGLNGVFRAIPAIGLGLFGGTMADRYDRKRLMLITQVTSMLLAFGLAVLAQTELIQVWHIYGLTVVGSEGQVLDLAMAG
jgi:MFS family permease